MSRAFYISHNIFLNDGDAEKAQEVGTEIIADGVCVPVLFDNGHTTETATEIFAKYKICNCQDRIILKPDQTGFVFNLSDPNRLKSLLPVRKGGAEFLAVCVTEAFATKEHGKIPIFHQIVIRPLSDLRQSLEPCHLPFQAVA